MLMDPLVSALNALNTLVSQGLRTLQLRVLAASINLDDEKHTLQKFFLHPNFFDNNIVNVPVIQNKIEENQRPKTLQNCEGHERPIYFPIDKAAGTPFVALGFNTTTTKLGDYTLRVGCFH